MTTSYCQSRPLHQRERRWLYRSLPLHITEILINERFGDHFRKTDTAVVEHQESAAEPAVETLLDIIRDPDLAKLVHH